jgi:hypothetical protein
MLSRIITIGLTSVGLTALAGGIPAADAAAAAPAGVTVTITAEGTDMSGVVKSSRPAQCAANRTVKVFKLVDGEPHLWASDTSSDTGEWSTGNTGTPGRFFAKVGKKPGCKGDVSPTIRVRRNPN